MIMKAVRQAKGNTMKKIMKATTTTLALLVAATLGGCSSTPKDAGKPFVQNPKESVALNVAAYAGYPYILRDNGYSNGLDALATSGGNAVLLASDLAGSLGSLGGASLGLGLGLFTSMAAEYPLPMSEVMTAKLNPGEDYRSAATVLRVLKANYEMREVREKTDGDTLKQFLGKDSLNDYVCEPTTYKKFDFECFDPAYKKYSHFVGVSRPANGTEFGEVMPLTPGSYGVYFMTSDRGAVLIPKADAPDPYFTYTKGVYVIGDTVLPKIAPREDGKRLVFLHGKATLI